MSPKASSGLIYVALEDGSPELVQVLGDVLLHLKHDARFLNMEDVQRITRDEPPVVVLLRIDVRATTGIGVLRALRADPATRSTPIVVMMDLHSDAYYDLREELFGVEFIECLWSVAVLEHALRRAIAGPRPRGMRFGWP